MLSRIYYKTIKITLSLLLCAAIISGPAVVLVGATTLTEQSLAKSYYEYYKEISGKLTADSEILLSMDDVVISEQNSKLLADHLGEGTAVHIEYDGFAEWEFDIQQDALYNIDLRYVSVSGNSRNPRVGFMIDGKVPFTGADSVEIKRLWRDKPGAGTDKRGNDLIPKQEEILQFQTVSLTDNSAFLKGAYSLFFTKGNHTLRIYVPDEPIFINHVSLSVGEQPLMYSDFLNELIAENKIKPSGVYLEYQAENTTLKSDQTLYPVYDRTNAATVPNDPEKIRRNVIGQTNWSKPGMWVTYTIEDIPADGLYLLSLKYRQNYQLGMSTYRTIYVNEKIQFAEMASIAFPFGFSWQNRSISDSSGQPCYVYLNKGINTIKIESTIGDWAEVFAELNEVLADLNNVYRRIIMVTSTSPDLYRDYKLENEITGLQVTLKELSDKLNELADRFDFINGSKSAQSQPLRRASEQLAEFSLKTGEIPKRLVKFRENIALLSSWLLSRTEQPLEIDYFMIHSADAVLPSPQGSFWSNLRFSFMCFLAAFKKDYNSLSDHEEHTAISVWSAEGRDQVQILKDMITDGFTAETGIQVNLNLVQSGYEAGFGDWMLTGEDFPAGMNRIANTIRSAGFKPGITFCPFVCSSSSLLFRERREILLKDARGKLVCAGHNRSLGGKLYIVDLYNPEGERYIKRCMNTFINEWGMQVIRAEMLYVAALNSGVQAGRTRAQAMTHAMKILRKYAGNIPIIACGVQLGSAFGLVEFCSVTPDLSQSWHGKTTLRCRKSLRERESTEMAVMTAITRRHLDLRAFSSDMGSFTLRRYRGRMAAIEQITLFKACNIFSSLITGSDSLGAYNAESLDRFLSAVSSRPVRRNDRSVLGVTVRDDGLRVDYMLHGVKSEEKLEQVKNLEINPRSGH
jgi:hypothetical protein